MSEKIMVEKIKKELEKYGSEHFKVSGGKEILIKTSYFWTSPVIEDIQKVIGRCTWCIDGDKLVIFLGGER